MGDARNHRGETGRPSTTAPEEEIEDPALDLAIWLAARLIKDDDAEAPLIMAKIRELYAIADPAGIARLMDVLDGVKAIQAAKAVDGIGEE